MTQRFLMLAVLLASLATLGASEDKAITPTETISLFNGKDLTNFSTWLTDFKYEDPHRVFTVVDQVDGAPAIRSSGQYWGGIVTKERYQNYHLIVEFRWGTATWGKRKNSTKDSGILLHCEGPEGNAAADFNSPWMRSVEFQIIEGGTGDIILVGGFNKDGQRINPRLTATVSGDKRVWDPNGTPKEFEGGRINWYGRDPEWKDVLGFRGKQDVEKPDGQWNKLDAFVDGDSLVYLVNGVVVNKATGSSLKAGKLLFQSEGAEIFFRRIELQPLGKRP
jgi:hypothetical protein